MGSPSGNFLQFAIEAMAHLVRWFTELKDGVAILVLPEGKYYMW